MINTLKHRTLLVTAIFMVAAPAFSQAPTDAQRAAIRSECRSDYEAHCASIPPGGAASLQCLQKNMSSLSSGCQTAVRAVEAPAAAAPKAESAPRRGNGQAAPHRGSSRRSQSCGKHAGSRSRPMRRLPRSAAHAAPTIKRSAPACRPAGRRRCNAWKRTRRKYPRPASKRSMLPAAAPRRLPPPVLRPRPPLPLPERQPRRRGADRAGAAADAAARGVVRIAVGMQRRCSHAVRRRGTRRRPYRAVSGCESGLDLAGLQGSPGAVRRPIDQARRRAGDRWFRRPPATRRETRGSTGSTGPTARRSRSSSRPDTQHASSALQACKDRRENSAPEG